MMTEAQFRKTLKRARATLYFEDGTSFVGFVNRDPSDSELQSGVWGEAAFTTGMSGYQETATDPSFLGQHIIYTSSHIGNYESDPASMQSKGVHASTCLITMSESPPPVVTDRDTALPSWSFAAGEIMTSVASDAPHCP